MSPLINDGDIVAVDGSQTNPEELNRKIVVAWHRESGLSAGAIHRGRRSALAGIGKSRIQPGDRGKRPEVADRGKGSVVDSERAVRPLVAQTSVCGVPLELG